MAKDKDRGVMPHCKRTCADCPWLRDVEPGKFPPERFVALANTAYDMAGKVFACHQSKEDKPYLCAGAALQVRHNLAQRMRGPDLDTIEAIGPLFDTFREMAEANGVPADHPALARCR